MKLAIKWQSIGNLDKSRKTKLFEYFTQWISNNPTWVIDVLEIISSYSYGVISSSDWIFPIDLSPMNLFPDISILVKQRT